MAPALRIIELPSQNPGAPPLKWPQSLFEVPYLDDELMHGPASKCSAADFKKPRLRKSIFDFASIDWNKSRPLGGGADGFVWKVWFGDDGPYALKVFWDAAPRQFYWGIQRECQTAALLQMMHTALEKAAIESAPVVVNTNPKVLYEEDITWGGEKIDTIRGVDKMATYHNAKSNLDAFSDEARHARSGTRLHTEESDTMALSSMPRMVQCHGWLKFSGESYNHMVPSRLKAPRGIPIEKGFSRNERGFEDAQEYTAIVYEYVDEGPNDPTAVEEVARFLFLAGFMFTSSLDKNWRQSILVDHSDIVNPRGYGWNHQVYELDTAATLHVLKESGD